MTREEAAKYADNMTYRDAINNLMKAKSIPYRKATFIKVNELLKALEKEPCEDAISRQAVLDIIKFEYDWLLDAKGHNDDTRIAFHGMKSKVLALPPVNPQEPKTGHWIVSEYKDEIYTNIATCSLCNAEVINNGVDEFCPNCGAKMTESEDK